MWGVGGMFNNLKTSSSWPSATGGPPTQYEWMQASYYYQGAGVNRDKVWADLQRLSSSKNYGVGIIWNYNPNAPKYFWKEVEETGGRGPYTRHRKEEIPYP